MTKEAQGRDLQLILGPPGTGKTTTLLNIVEQHLQDGVRPERIAFVSFTKKAASEAAQRAIDKFGLSYGQFPNFRTLHSTAYQALGIRRDEVMGRTDYKEIATMLGVEFSGYSDISEGVNAAVTEGDLMLNIIAYTNATKQELRNVWAYLEEPIDWFKLKQFKDTIHTYKGDTGKLDFDDMILNFTQSRISVDVDVAIIDEAQDLSNAQWDMAKAAFRGAKHVYIAGDDDQCLYHWCGANVDRFMGINASRRVLPITYRLPVTIQRLAEKVSNRISYRYKKEWITVDDRQGSIQSLASVEHLHVGEGSWMLLARNSRNLDDYIELCHEQGIPYHTKKGPSVDPEHLRAIKAWERLRGGGEASEEDHNLIHKLLRQATYPLDQIWHDALRGIPAEHREYYLSILRGGRRLQDCQSTYIGTIHSVKGGEADNVVLRTDLSYRTAQAYARQPDPEHRVFYVGATRAKENLFIIEPQGAEAYAL